ncbi:MAG: EAL domain-containing protein [Chloroflexaceae bacterium]|nr:EAL domain-containing protein [Chloroflexaceae bacterium]
MELTETAAINDKPDVLKLLKQLKRWGIQLFIDDFGTGYSSLMSVQSFPFDGLKIDRSFVSRLDAIAGTSQIIIANILDLAGNLGMVRSQKVSKPKCN